MNLVKKLIKKYDKNTQMDDCHDTQSNQGEAEPILDPEKYLSGDPILDKILDKLRKEANGNIGIQTIIRGEEVFIIYPSDKYGNDEDMIPFSYDRKTGEPVSLEFDFDASGVRLEVPEGYRTYRGIVYSALDDNIPNSVWDNLGICGIDLPINYIFLDYIHDISVSELYAICNYFINLVALSCNVEEQVGGELRKNPIIQNFLKLKIPEKLAYVDDYYYRPDYIQNIDALSNQLLLLAKEKQLGKPISQDDSNKLIEDIRKAISEAISRLDIEDNPLCNIKHLKNHLGLISAYSEIESDYCNGISDKTTERMKEIEGIGFTSRPSFNKQF